MARPSIVFDNTFAKVLAGLYVPWKPAAVPAPRLLFLNRPLAEELGLDPADLETADGAELFAGNALPEGAEPLAQAYAGHQFGAFSPQLGDGRALLLGEVIDRCGRRRDIAFKGSGRTPFARGGDGKAAVGPMLREVVISEAMHALGIPTTRALAVAATGEPVYRERTLPGAVLTRVALSHLRVGTFEFFWARRDLERLRQLAEYTIARHDPELAGAPDRYLGVLRAVGRRQASLVAQWMNVGFIHGVMNTDNMTVSGETIDYGPCAFIEAYDPETVFSSIDHGGRYAYGNQPRIAAWNLARLAETLIPLMVPADEEPAIQQAVEQATAVVREFADWYKAALLEGQRFKLGLYAARPEDDERDGSLVDDWLGLLVAQQVDFTLAWCSLADAAGGSDDALRRLFADPTPLEAWLVGWRERCARDEAGGGPPAPERAARMRGVNPWIIPRNHRVEEALAAASDQGDLTAFNRLLSAVQHPYQYLPERASYAEPAPPAVTAQYQTFCGT